MTMPKVSVVIPCYNQGQFIDDAVDSVLAQSFTDFEIIVINDGSTDGLTNRLLHNYTKDKTRVIVTANMGLAAARNNGIAVAAGKYILPLDADDRIESTYLEKAVAILDADTEVGIVYCNARLFGAVETEWILPEYSLEKMLLDNLIFCSAFFRKDDWQEAGGYDPGMVNGWEDYEFWLGLIERGRKVVRIQDILFYYRVASDSMVRSKEKWQKVAMFRRIYERHQQLFSENIGVWIDTLVDARDKYYTSRLYVDCGSGISEQSSVGRKIELGTRLIVFDLRKFSGITALRFDPVDTWAVVGIDRITMVYGSGEKTEVMAIESNALYKQHDLLLFDTCDSQCYFPDLNRSVLSGVVQIIVELRFIAFAELALEHIVEYQKAELEMAAAGMIPKKIRQAGRVLLKSLKGAEKGS
ncbi:MAG: glycosyltransferase [Proteobacteria bacterium]|nr:glycosyltransferase [Pseudomonadota bacterium]